MEKKADIKGRPISLKLETKIRLLTHAFFKALLFLGAGSVIHSCHHEQDMNKLGGLASKMPITHATFLLATLAISGIPPLAGFWSKEQIIKAAWEAGPANLTFILAIRHYLFLIIIFLYHLTILYYTTRVYYNSLLKTFVLGFDLLVQTKYENY